MRPAGPRALPPDTTRICGKTMIQDGTPATVALTALMRKLIEIASAGVRQDREWAPKTA